MLEVDFLLSVRVLLGVNYSLYFAVYCRWWFISFFYFFVYSLKLLSYVVLWYMCSTVLFPFCTYSYILCCSSLNCSTITFSLALFFTVRVLPGCSLLCVFYQGDLHRRCSTFNVLLHHFLVFIVLHLLCCSALYVFVLVVVHSFVFRYAINRWWCSVTLFCHTSSSSERLSSQYPTYGYHPQYIRRLTSSVYKSQSSSVHNKRISSPVHDKRLSSLVHKKRLSSPVHNRRLSSPVHQYKKQTIILSTQQQTIILSTQ